MFDIITDSACDLTPDTAKQLGVEVVPFYVSLDGEHYRKEGKEITVRDFYQFMVDNPAAYPKTSLASIKDFETAFRAHAAAGRDVLCLVFTGKMSGCVGSARNARELVLEDYPDARIEVMDSTAATVTEAVVGPHAAGVVHYIIQTAQPGDHTADAGSHILGALHIDTRSVCGGRVFAHGTQVQAAPGAL